MLQNTYMAFRIRTKHCVCDGGVLIMKAEEVLMLQWEMLVWSLDGPGFIQSLTCACSDGMNQQL